MNVIVSNLNKDKFSDLDVDIIKSVSGEFSADEIVQSFSNFFFNRMFLDITSIKDYANIANIQKLSIGLDVSKIIILLNDDPVVNSKMYISRLINMGIYNFAKSSEEVKYLYSNPNIYKDVAHLQIVDDEVVETNEELVSNNVVVIGFKNFTSHAGSSSLIYMLKKQLSKNYYVVCMEINKKDFLFFRDKDMISISDNSFKDNLVKYKDANIILVDLNDLDDVMAKLLCNEVIYLIEPSVLAINKIAMLDPKSFDKLKDFKVVLNDCLLNDRDVIIFGKEAGVDIFYSLPPMNDRMDNSKILLPFLEKLGLYTKVDDDGNGKNKKSFFKF